MLCKNGGWAKKTTGCAVEFWKGCFQKRKIYLHCKLLHSKDKVALLGCYVMWSLPRTSGPKGRNTSWRVGKKNSWLKCSRRSWESRKQVQKRKSRSFLSRCSEIIWLHVKLIILFSGRWCFKYKSVFLANKTQDKGTMSALCWSGTTQWKKSANLLQRKGTLGFWGWRKNMLPVVPKLISL